MNTLQAALNAFDAANRQDPNCEIHNGKSHPKELIYAERMSQSLALFAPDASEVLQLAARCQHIERWLFPRANFPMNLQGYNSWRTGLNKFHAKRAGEIMLGAGFDEKIIHRVGELLLKKRLKLDPEVQVLEDVVCLVFIEYYLADFALKHEESKLLNIIRKTWKKMSPKGHSAALALNLPKNLLQLVGKALENKHS